MFTISKRGDYGLEILTVLTRQGRNAVMPLRQLTRESKLPYRFASQLAVALKEAGILGSREGAGGGYFLAKDPKTVTIADVVKVLEGDKGLVKCVGTDCHREGICQCRSTWHELERNIRQVMGTYTLSDLVKGTRE
jgi:Rrf2 family protein